MNDKSYNPFEMAQKQLDHAAGLLELDQPVRALLRVPMREHHFSIPVRMDDGSVRILRGFRIQHNDARPVPGGHPLPPSGDGGYPAGDGDVDDVEMRRG